MSIMLRDTSWLRVTCPIWHNPRARLPARSRQSRPPCSATTQLSINSNRITTSRWSQKIRIKIRLICLKWIWIAKAATLCSCQCISSISQVKCNKIQSRWLSFWSKIKSYPYKCTSLTISCWAKPVKLVVQRASWIRPWKKTSAWRQSYRTRPRGIKLWSLSTKIWKLLLWLLSESSITRRASSIVVIILRLQAQQPSTIKCPNSRLAKAFKTLINPSSVITSTCNSSMFVTRVVAPQTKDLWPAS